MKLPTRPETFACHPAEVAGDGFFPVHEPHISANEYPHNQMKSIQIGDLKITLPIIQGGMGVGISLSGLASAVANEGGVGVISCAGIGLIYPKFSNDYRTNSIMGLREEIRKARAKTSGVIGVNIMVALSNFADMVRTAIEEKADIIFSGAGLPLDLPSYLGEKSLTKLVPIVSSARAAHIICEKWKTNYNYLPDAIVVEGPKAGGHLGYKNTQIEDDNFSLERLIPEVVATADRFAAQHAHPIPVIAAGDSIPARISTASCRSAPPGYRWVASSSPPPNAMLRRRSKKPISNRAKRISRSSRVPWACRAGRSAANS